MKTCKFCNAELPEGTTVCPSCGKDNKKTLSPVSTILAIAAVVAVVVLTVGVMLGVKNTAQAQQAETAVVETTVETTAPVETEPPTVPADGNPDDVTCKGTYTYADDAVIAARDKVIATSGDFELTLAQLQVYYWMEVRNFMSQYGAYAAYFGLDINQSLDTQICNLTETSQTWQQFFLGSALNTWHNYRAMAAEADQNGYQMNELQLQAIANAGAELDEAAQANGFESGLDMIHSSLGNAAELEDYTHFMELYYKANGYYNQLAEQFHPTEEEMDAFFEEHADGYAASGITKQTKTVDVRHILLYPEGADGSNIFTEEFSEEAWAAGEASANAILEEFLAGEQTAERFAALAEKHSQDPGSNQNGGLYEDVQEGEMVQAFNDWCFDENRQVGDTGVVKTEYGYHVMYFCGSTPVWQQYVESDYITEKANALADELVAKYPLTVHYGDIMLTLSELR